MHAGFPVPDGFIVSTEAYATVVEEVGLAAVISDGLAAGDDGATIRAAFEDVAIPDDLAAAIGKAYADLGAGPVAVRSSATTEDLARAAFAGQQDTYLNVIGETAVLDAVRRCWGSLWTERAIAYRRHQQIESGNLRIAVVVQRMVDAEFAGVMFTANPVTGERDEVVIDASSGLGEAVVAGLVTPDHYVLDGRDEFGSTRLAGARWSSTVRQAAVSLVQPKPARNRPLCPIRFSSSSPPKAAQSPHTSASRRTSSGRTPTAGSGWSRRVR
jgi:rifampicin phosphotransferase